MSAITAKEIRALKVLAKGEPVIASWSHQLLCDLRRRGYVAHVAGRTVAGKLADMAVWTITARGRDFLADERAGQ